jgi:transcriptional regulator with XRE-family HTH domain
MDDLRVGRLLRAIRRRRGLRQLDVAIAADVGQSTVSLIERGHLDRLAIRTVRLVFATVDARFEGSVAWRGGAIDRLLDERHALVVGRVAALLISAHWLVQLEISYSEYGERGSIDLLAYDPVTRTLLVVEAKTELTSIEETARRHDTKVRLAAKIAAERFGWDVRGTGRLLVVLDTSTSRRRVARHDGTLSIAYPVRGREVTRLLRHARRPFSGLMFLSLSNPGGSRRAPPPDPSR